MLSVEDEYAQGKCLNLVLISKDKLDHQFTVNATAW